MIKNTVPVVAAVPNFNMAEGLRELLPELTRQEYSRIYVLDDASTDDTREVVAEYDERVKLVAGSENLGAAGNRNRILDSLGYRAIVHFIDADMDLETNNVPEIANDLMAGKRLGFVGGLIRTSRRRQMAFNYGPRQCLRTDLASHLHGRIWGMLDTNRTKAHILQNRYAYILKDLPNPFEAPTSRRVFWTAEGNFLIDSEVFRAVDGFDLRLRNHGIQDLAIRIARLGLERRFEPVFAAAHNALQVRMGNRALQMAKDEFYIARKHGLGNWLRPNGKFCPEL